MFDRTEEDYPAPEPTGPIMLFFKRRWAMPSILLWDVVELPFTLLSTALYVVMRFLLRPLLGILLWPVGALLRRCGVCETNPFSVEFVGKQILQAQNISSLTFKDRDEKFKTKANLDKALSVSYPRVKTHPIDGSGIKEERRDIIDTVEIHPESIKESKDGESKSQESGKKYHIYFLGTSMCYQDQNEFGLPDINVFEIMKDDVLTDDGCCAIGFNYRGVGTISSPRAPRSTNDLVTDGIAQVQRLLDKNIKADNITLDGVSLGAGIATLVAYYFHAHGYKIHLRNDRGFSTLTNTIAGWVWNWQHPYYHRLPKDKKWWHTPVGMFLGAITWLFLKPTLSALDFEIDAAFAYMSLPDTHKTHMYVRSSKERRANGEALDDAVIPDSAALHNSTYLKIGRWITQLKLYLCGTKEEREAYQHEIMAAKMHTLKGEENTDGHTRPRNALENCYAETGLAFFNRRKDPSSRNVDISNKLPINHPPVIGVSCAPHS